MLIKIFYVYNKNTNEIMLETLSETEAYCKIDELEPIFDPFNSIYRIYSFFKNND